MVLAAALVSLVAMVAACAPETSTPTVNAAGLHLDLVDGGFVITWNPTPAGNATGYDLQYRTNAGWVTVPTTTEPEVLFTDVVENVWYNFRVRTRVVAGAQPNEFSATERGLYVEPKLPIVRVDTTNHVPIVVKETWLDATMKIDPNGTSFEPYEGTLKVRGRGNSTWQMPKKPYKLKLNSKAGLMGMEKSKKYALLANAFDKSALRTYAMEQMGKATDLPWTPSFRHVELILNGQYMGVYQLAEEVKVEETRVNIPEMTEADEEGEALTGGYLMEIDARLEENNEPGWRTPKNVAVVVKDPEPATRTQMSYIKSFVNNFESVLFSSNYEDPVDGYAKYLDVGSFIDYWIVQEVTRNGDSFWSSTYFYKDRNDDRLHFGPLWDFDHSLGMTGLPKAQPPEGWYARGNGAWTRRLFTDPAFVDAVHARWDQLAPVFQQISLELLDLSADLQPALANDLARWAYTPKESDTGAYISDWLTTRINWITDAFDGVDAGDEGVEAGA